MATIGTPEYSQALAGYLNNLSPEELIGLGGDFSVAGLARSDLSSVDPFGGNRQFRPGGYLKSDLAYSPEELNALSKYRNLEGMRGDEYGHSTMKAVGYGDMAGDRKRQEMINLWGTRNAPGTDEPLFRYSGGGFEQLPFRPSSNSLLEQFMDNYFAPLVVGGLTAGFGGLITAPTAAAAGAGNALADSFSLMGPGTGAAPGSTASLISGPGSLGIGSGTTAGMGANALAASPSFSLMTGAGSLGLDLGSQWALPEGLGSIDQYAMPKKIAKYAGKRVLNNAMSGAASQMPGMSMMRPQNALSSGDFELIPLPELNFIPQREVRY